MAFQGLRGFRAEGLGFVFGFWDLASQELRCDGVRFGKRWLCHIDQEETSRSFCIRLIFAGLLQDKQPQRDVSRPRTGRCHVRARTCCASTCCACLRFQGWTLSGGHLFCPAMPFLRIGHSETSPGSRNSLRAAKRSMCALRGLLRPNR